SVAKPPARVTVRDVLLANGSRLLRVSLRSQSTGPLSLSLLTRVGAKNSIVRLVLERGASRTLSVELPRARAGSRAYVLLSGAGLAVKRTVAAG
ncbi:MAG TPA: hypothetical protein VN817_04870, partial [Solirubrobacteraceae bacterium]|nr:hypothetical protein [Solirubrobacteraceae bacterium]